MRIEEPDQMPQNEASDKIRFFTFCIRNFLRKCEKNNNTTLLLEIVSSNFKGLESSFGIYAYQYH